jgi:hypothetical protein
MILKMPTTRRLHLIDDQQHHVCLMAEENKFSKAAMDPTKSTICLKTARKHAGLFIRHNIREYSQWFLGKKKNVANTLSWDFDLSYAELNKTLHLHYPSQVPPHFQVVPLPREIESWLTSLLL